MYIFTMEHMKCLSHNASLTYGYKLTFLAMMTRLSRCHSL